MKLTDPHRPVSRRELLRRSAVAAAALTLPAYLGGCRPNTGEDRETDPELAAEPPTAREETRAPAGASEDEVIFHEWVEAIRSRGLAETDVPLGRTTVGVGELAIGTPYVGFALEEYLRAGGNPSRTEPLTLSLTDFDCVSLVESCLAIARVARSPEPPTWEGFAREMERMRYRGGERGSYISRLHYFSEWIKDNAERGLVEPLGQQLGGEPDRRPLRFMTSNRDSYPALENEEVYQEVAAMERELDGVTRWVVPTDEISGVADRIQTGDILAFATSIEGLDVTHAAFAYRDEGGVLRVLHAPLSGGVVEITEATVPEYVRAIRRSTGILVARPLQG